MASVCIQPWAVSLARDTLTGSGVAVCTVIGFPQGTDATGVKEFAARTACESGAMELLNMVVNVSKVLSRDWAYVSADIRAVADVAHAHSGLLKVIFENEFLPDDSFKMDCAGIARTRGPTLSKPRPLWLRQAARRRIRADRRHRPRSGADLRQHAAPHVQVKASGGVRTYFDALRVVGLGATRIGTSSTEAIAAGERGANRPTPAADSY